MLVFHNTFYCQIHVYCNYGGHFKSSAHCTFAASRMMHSFWFLHQLCARLQAKNLCQVFAHSQAKLSLFCNIGQNKMEEENDSSQITQWPTIIYIKIKNLWGKNLTGIHALREVCGDSVVDHKTVAQWASCFSEGRVSIQDKPRSGWPATAMDDMSVVILLEEDWLKSCEETTDEANISTTSVFRILTQILQKITVKWVLYQLSQEQKAACKRIMKELLQRYKTVGEQFF